MTTKSRSSKRAVPSDRSAVSWGAGRRWFVSGLLILHLMAVFAPPFAFQTSPIRGLGSPVAEVVMQWMRPYIDAMYLNHGYAFFAPDPGPSHLLIAKLEFDDGREPMTLTFPDLKRHQPRLLYHRHFMLSEHLNGAFVPAEVPPDMADDPLQRQAWQQSHQRYERRRAAAIAHLKNKYGADRVELVRVEHRLLAPLEVINDRKDVDDPDTYLEMSEEGTEEELR